MAIISIAVLVVGIASSPAFVSLVNAQDTQQDYTNFQNCLSSIEVDGVVTEQQITDCVDSTYGETDGSDSSSDDSGDNSGNGDGNGDGNDNCGGRPGPR